MFNLLNLITIVNTSNQFCEVLKSEGSGHSGCKIAAVREADKFVLRNGLPTESNRTRRMVPGLSAYLGERAQPYSANARSSLKISGSPRSQPYSAIARGLRSPTRSARVHEVSHVKIKIMHDIAKSKSCRKAICRNFDLQINPSCKSNVVQPILSLMT